MTTDQPTLAVTQADIDAAMTLCAEWDILSIDHVARFLARHRTNSESRPAGDLREAYNRCAIIARQFAEEVNEDGVIVHNPSAISSGYEICHRIIQAASALATHSPAPMAGEGWIVGNNVGQWRTFDSFGWAWTNRRDLAVRYARREDAELVHGDDEDSWRVEQYPTAAHPSTQEGGDRG